MLCEILAETGYWPREIPFDLDCAITVIDVINDQQKAAQ